MPGPITDDLAELFAETILVSGWASQTAFGDATYSAGVTYNCHIEGQSRLVRDPSGRERVSSAQVYLDGAYGVGVLDRILLPVRYDPRSPPIISVGRMSDENGPHNEVIFV